METKIEDALSMFMEYNKEMNEALKVLRDAVKEQGSESIQRFISEENFTMANQIISELNEFTGLEYNSNAEEIYNFAEHIIKQQEKLKPIDKKTLSSIEKKSRFEKKITQVSVVKEKFGITEEEKELIKTLGYTSVSRVKDSKTPIEENDVLSLFDKGYVDLEEIEMNGKIVLVFELSEKGKEEFEKQYNMEPNESFKTQIYKKHQSLSTGFFLYDAENALETRGYKVHEIGVHQIEVSKEKRYSYLTPDLGEFKEENYFKILNRKNQLKNIGFVCINEEVMKQAQEVTAKWAEQNQSKCKLLTIHFTTIDKIENTPNVFETIKF